jgi:hypothetical protein
MSKLTYSQVVTESSTRVIRGKGDRKLKSRCSCCESCRFVGTAVWPGTYTRLGANKHLVKDIEIGD